MKDIEQTPIGWEIDIMFLFAHCATILASDIELQLKLADPSDGFVPSKKKALKEYNDCIKNVRYWFNRAEEKMEAFGLDKSTYEAVDSHNKRYSNVIANANEMIRFNMLMFDRAHTEDGSAKVFKRLRSLPEQGVFPEKFLERFQMKYELYPEVGDRVHTTNHGDGELLLHLGNENWNIKLDSGKEIVLNEKQFKLL